MKFVALLLLLRKLWILHIILQNMSATQRRLPYRGVTVQQWKSWLWNRNFYRCNNVETLLLLPAVAHYMIGRSLLPTVNQIEMCLITRYNFILSDKQCFCCLQPFKSHVASNTRLHSSLTMSESSSSSSQCRSAARGSPTTLSSPITPC